MSGGHFDYTQYRMEDVAVEIDYLIDRNDREDCPYPQKIIERFKEAAHTIRQAQEMIERVDYLVSGDDGEESFMTCWDNEVREYFQSSEV